MLIEFFGLPGSGKSTLSRHVADLLLARGHEVVEPTYDFDHQRHGIGRLWGKSGHVALYALTNPYRAAFDLASVTASRQATPADLAKSAFNWLLICSLARRPRSPAGVMLLDQGMAQAMWSIAFAARRENWLGLISSEPSRRALFPDVIIHVRTRLPMISERLTSRKRRASRLDAYGRDQEKLRHAEAIADVIIGRFALCGVRVIEVENDDAQQLASSARRVASLITEQVGGTRDAAQEQIAAAVSPLLDRTGPPLRQVGSTFDRHQAPTREAGGGS